jgi:GTP cyclohydrolase II
MRQLKIVPPVDAPCATCKLPTQWGEFEMRVLRSSGAEPVVLSMGVVDDGEPVLARVHSECLTGDVFSSRRCDCEAQLHAAMEAIAKEERGVLVYLRQEGRGIGLYNKIRAYQLQEQGADTVDANRLLGLGDDLRQYDTAAEILSMLGVSSVRLMTNNPVKVQALEDLGIEVKERIGLHVGENLHNINYIKTKQNRFQHWSD